MDEKKQAELKVDISELINKYSGFIDIIFIKDMLGNEYGTLNKVKLSANRTRLITPRKSRGDYHNLLIQLMEKVEIENINNSKSNIVALFSFNEKIKQSLSREILSELIASGNLVNYENEIFIPNSTRLQKIINERTETSMTIKEFMEKTAEERNKILDLEKIINELYYEKGEPISTDSIIEIAKSKGLDEEFIKRGLEDLQSKGVIFKPYKDHWRKA